MTWTLARTRKLLLAALLIAACPLLHGLLRPFSLSRPYSSIRSDARHPSPGSSTTDLLGTTPGGITVTERRSSRLPRRSIFLLSQPRRDDNDAAGGPSEPAAAPPLSASLSSPREFREAVRAGRYTGPTNGCCPGFMQCNLVVLEEDRSFDFLLFCQRNKKACPLIEVCDAGSPSAEAVAAGSDLRTDVPRYCIYRDGKLDAEVEDATPYWPERSVAFLIGCSFSYDGALLDAGIPLRSVEQGKNVPMYRTNIPCRPAGGLRGNVVVSMKPIKATDVAKEVEITEKYPHAHGGPLCVGRPGAIGIEDVTSPEWGESVDILPDEIPVFHACGITPQAVLMESGVSFAITHSPGHMFVTDLPSDTVI